jgi:hypothetical protein
MIFGTDRFKSLGEFPRKISKFSLKSPPRVMRGRKAKLDNVVPMRPDDPAEIREEVVGRLIRRLQS